MREHGFDFSREWRVDFNVVFYSWPPSHNALDLLRACYGDVDVCQPSGEFNGYFAFKVFGKVTYEMVTSVQRKASSLMEPFGGVCDTWGVLH